MNEAIKATVHERTESPGLLSNIGVPNTIVLVSSHARIDHNGHLEMNAGYAKRLNAAHPGSRREFAQMIGGKREYGVVMKRHRFSTPTGRPDGSFYGLFQDRIGKDDYAEYEIVVSSLATLSLDIHRLILNKDVSKDVVVHMEYPGLNYGLSDDKSFPIVRCLPTNFHLWK